jgi:hypothetical protein
MGRTSGSSASNNGKNEMFFRNVSAGGTVAETYWWSDASGRLIDADIMFYDGGITFFTGSSGCSGGLYIEDTAAHEFGHALGLGHSADPNATMYYVTSWCSTGGRSLAADDLAGVEALYPPSSAPRNAAPTVSLSAPADGAGYSAPATVAVSATASDADGSISKVDFLVNGATAATDTSAPYNATLSNLAAGVYVLSAVATDNAGATATSAPRTITVTAAVTGTPGTAAYVTTDTTTQGTWKGVYGTDGYAVAGDATSLPAYAQLTLSGQSFYTWTGSTSDVRALQRAAGDRVMAAWYGGSFTIDLNVTGTQPRTVTIYADDYDSSGRQQRYDLIDAISGAVLDSRTLSTFSNGQYVVWNVLGRVKVRVTGLAGPNAVVSGVFFGGGAAAGGGGGTASGNTATYVKSDTALQGTWKGAYGSEGYAIAADTTSLPADTQVTVTGQSQYVWQGSTTDLRALQRATTDRVMAAWYGNTFTIDVLVSGSSARQIAVYSDDYDYSGRQQRLDVVDATTGAVLDSRTLTAFTGGQYSVWTVKGHVLVRVTRLAGPNAVVSGLLIGGGAPASGGGGGGGGTGSAAYSKIDTTTQGTWQGVYGADGYAVAADALTLPADTQLTVTGSSQYVWQASTTDVRALQRGGGGDRVMAAWYGGAFTIDVNVGGTVPRQIAVYSADYDSSGRQQRFDLVDASSGAVLDTRTISAFTSGQHVVWTVQGHVLIKVTRLAGPNAVVSGVLIGGGSGGSGGGSPAASSATFLASDTVTQGAWKGVYGASGYSITGDASSIPGFLQMLLSGIDSWVWSASTADPRALQRATSGRVMAATYGGAFSIDVNLTDGAEHQVALYSADYDNWGRRQRIDVVDAVSGAVLDSRTVSAFSSGIYQVWNVRGHVILKVTALAGPNAVVSGLFIK